MSGVTDSTTPSSPPRAMPSVFISYASEDRGAARALRATLTEAGLDVWYDEDELTGGDAWDQKIRRQIRDCEYFMPIISATTEGRKEGYFRREWRLASERSLDMADDVLFIVPVAIDDTPELGARVPDKFLTVQWLRTPGGNATPALHHLLRRLVAGDHHARAPGPTRAPFQRTQAPFAPPLLAADPPPPGTPAPVDPPPPPPPSLPPMPPFPTVPEKGGFLHGVKFFAEVLWWALSAAWLLFTRAPRWVRILVTIWLVATLFSVPRCSRTIEHEPPAPRSKEPAQIAKNAIERLAQAAREAHKNGAPEELARLGDELAAAFSQHERGAPDAPGTGRRLMLAPFSRLVSDAPDDKFASAVFASLFGHLALSHPRDVGLFRQMPADASEASLLARAKTAGSTLVLVGQLTGEGDARALTVRLLAAADRATKWTASLPIAGAEPTQVAEKIADNVLPFLPPPRRK